MPEAKNDNQEKGRYNSTNQIVKKMNCDEGDTKFQKPVLVEVSRTSSESTPKSPHLTMNQFPTQPDGSPNQPDSRECYQFNSTKLDIKTPLISSSQVKQSSPRQINKPDKQVEEKKFDPFPSVNNISKLNVSNQLHFQQTPKPNPSPKEYRPTQPVYIPRLTNSTNISNSNQHNSNYYQPTFIPSSQLELTSNSTQPKYLPMNQPHTNSDIYTNSSHSNSNSNSNSYIDPNHSYSYSQHHPVHSQHQQEPKHKPSHTPIDSHTHLVDDSINNRNFPLRRRPQVGSSEWLHLRRENHKLVERKRREGINDTIKHLAQLIPGPEKHKGGILNRVVQFVEERLALEQPQPKLSLHREMTRRYLPGADAKDEVGEDPLMDAVDVTTSVPRGNRQGGEVLMEFDLGGKGTKLGLRSSFQGEQEQEQDDLEAVDFESENEDKNENENENGNEKAKGEVIGTLKGQDAQDSRINQLELEIQTLKQDLQHSFVNLTSLHKKYKLE